MHNIQDGRGWRSNSEDERSHFREYDGGNRCPLNGGGSPPSAQREVDRRLSVATESLCHPEMSNI